MKRYTKAVIDANFWRVIGMILTALYLMIWVLVFYAAITTDVKYEPKRPEQLIFILFLFAFMFVKWTARTVSYFKGLKRLKEIIGLDMNEYLEACPSMLSLDHYFYSDHLIDMTVPVRVHFSEILKVNYWERYIKCAPFYYARILTKDGRKFDLKFSGSYELQNNFIVELERNAPDAIVNYGMPGYESYE